VTDGRVKIVPERYAKSYLDWLGEKRDWPVSRQLWWGHQIPVWTARLNHEYWEKWKFPGKGVDTKQTTVYELQRPFIDAGLDVDSEVAIEIDRDSGDIRLCTKTDDADKICARIAEEIEVRKEGKHPLHSQYGMSATYLDSLVREQDVLDTWFSSALWPHSTLGWPEKTADLAYYYPTSVLITSRDIITLWVARMVMTGLYNLGEVPFRQVFIHPKILDGYGETMSKSKGNGVDPLDIIEKFGTDALRFTLADLTTETQDVRMPVEFECPHCEKLIEQTKQNRILARVKCKHCGEEFSTQWAEKDADKALPRGAVVSERFEKGRNFCNKLWNAARFALMNLEGYKIGTVAESELLIEDRWILSRLATVTKETTASLAEYRYSDAAGALYGFAWDEFCSFYVEMVKARLSDEALRPAAQRVLAHVLDTLLRLLHPMIPFVTEEIWHLLGESASQRGIDRLTQAAESIMIAPWPEADTKRQDKEIEARFARFQDVLRAILQVRTRQGVTQAKEVGFSVRCDAATADLLRPMRASFLKMANARPTGFGPEISSTQLSANVALTGMEVFVDLAELIDVGAELERTQREVLRLEGLKAAKQKKLENENFVQRAPAAVVQGEREALKDLEDQLAAAKAVIERLRNTSA
jgi:valyl-tRNA synthetase